MLTGISPGEIVDRLAVLRVRSLRHMDETQQRLAEWELGVLMPQMEALGITEDSPSWRWMFACHLRMWGVVQRTRKMADDGEALGRKFGDLSLYLVELEHLRTGIKDRINRRLKSDVLEVNSDAD